MSLVKFSEAFVKMPMAVGYRDPLSARASAREAEHAREKPAAAALSDGLAENERQRKRAMALKAAASKTPTKKKHRVEIALTPALCDGAVEESSPCSANPFGSA